jgi:hypothetical protein
MYVREIGCETVDWTHLLQDRFQQAVKVKAKLSLCFNRAPRHESVLGSGGIAPRILDLGTRWR